MENTNNSNNGLNSNQNVNSDNNNGNMRPLYNLLHPNEFYNIPEDVRNNLPQSSIDDWKSNARAYGYDPNMIHNNMNGMLDFLFENNAIRVIVNGPTPDCTLFCGPDVANVLGYGHPAHMYRILSDYEKIVININIAEVQISDLSSNGVRHTQDVVFITLPGLFRVIARSRHPKAMEFQNWVYHKVLPDIWSYGYYASNNTRNVINIDPMMAVKYNKKIEELEARNTILSNQVDEMTSWANTGKAIEIDNIDTTLNTLCKIIQNNLSFSFGLHDMMAHLRFDGFLIRDKMNYNMPTQKSLNMGVLKAVYDHELDRYVPIVTPNGVNYFINYFMNKLLTH